ncbi:MAG: hypothetical protein PVI23_13065 [Maricaulaceae bacterium]
MPITHLRWVIPVLLIGVVAAGVVWVIAFDPLPELPPAAADSIKTAVMLVLIGVAAVVWWRVNMDEVAKEAMKFASLLALPITILLSFAAVLLVRRAPPVSERFAAFAETANADAPASTVAFGVAFIFFTVTAALSWIALYTGWWIAKR